MNPIYYDADADLGVLEGMTIGVVGYGNQGRSQALNLRDSGLELIVGNIADESFDQARTDGFETMSIVEACKRAQLVMLLVPDEVMPDVYARDVAPYLKPGDVIDFASGYNVAFGLIKPTKEVDVIMIGPRMIGPGVRDTFVSGEGFPSFVGVHQDASGQAKARMLALAKALGSTRAGCIEMSLHDEATLDLFTEQALAPALGNMLITAVQILVDAGYPPEAVLLELYLSGEMIYAFEKIREVGMNKQAEFHSRTSQYGSMTRGARFAEVMGPISDLMKGVLQEIRSGAFAEEWSTDREKKLELLEELSKIRDTLPLSQWELQTRKAFKIGDAAESED